MIRKVKKKSRMTKSPEVINRSEYYVTPIEVMFQLIINSIVMKEVAFPIIISMLIVRLDTSLIQLMS